MYKLKASADVYLIRFYERAYYAVDENQRNCGFRNSEKAIRRTNRRWNEKNLWSNAVERFFSETILCNGIVMLNYI